MGALAGCATAPRTRASNLVGTWRFIEFVDFDSAGRATYLLGRAPRGYLIYTTTGHVSVHLGPGADVPAASWESYVGTYSLDSGGTAVIHHIEGSSAPITANDEARPFVLRGDTLILGDGRTWRRVLVRVRSPQP